MLVRRLFTLGLNKKQIEDLFFFIDWLIGLPEELELEYINEMHFIEETFKMPYITTPERVGIRKTTKEIAKRMLAKGFNINEVMELTLLTQTEINSLQSEINNQNKIDINDFASA